MDEGLKVRRQLTLTPLARQYERSLERGLSRRRREIPWSDFDGTIYPKPARELAAAYYRRIAGGEYLAVDTFARMTAALTGVGAPLDLIESASEITHDEIRHCAYMLRFTSLLSGEPLAEVTSEVSASQMAERRRAYHGRNWTPAQIDLWMIEVPALGETFACSMLLDCCRRAQDPVASALLKSIAADEIRHARLGWYWLAWRSAQWTRPEKQRLANRAAELVIDAPRRFGGAGVDAPPGSRRAIRALGILDTRSLRASVARALDDEVVPGFEALGFGTGDVRRREKAS